MASKTFATVIDEDVNEAVRTVCKAHGWKINKFVENALIDRLEELEDMEDLKSLRKESTKSITTVIRELRSRGKI